MSDQDLILQDEIEALLSIYNDTEITVSYDKSDRLFLYQDKNSSLNIKILIYNNYPNVVPKLEISYSKFNNSSMTLLNQKVLDKLNDLKDCQMLYDIIEFIKGYISDSKNDDENVIIEIDDTSKFDSTDIDFKLYHLDYDNRIFHSSVITEKKSSFQSHFMILQSLDDINIFRSIILRDKRCAKATHNIFAYRYQCPITNTLYHDCDDDGETAAGKRLAEMIRLMNVKNVAVIVSRWFGGTLLGPERFKHICNIARTLLEDHGY